MSNGQPLIGSLKSIHNLCNRKEKYFKENLPPPSKTFIPGLKSKLKPNTEEPRLGFPNVQHNSNVYGTVYECDRRGKGNKNKKKNVKKRKEATN